MQPNSLHNKTIGSKGEQIAATYLQSKGQHVIAMNVTSRWGEIDLVAKRGDTLVFVEVKTRMGLLRGKPYEAVGYYKMSRLKRAAQYYVICNRRPEKQYAMDVVSIVLDRKGKVVEIQHFESVG